MRPQRGTLPSVVGTWGQLISSHLEDVNSLECRSCSERGPTGSKGHKQRVHSGVRAAAVSFPKSERNMNQACANVRTIQYTYYGAFSEAIFWEDVNIKCSQVLLPICFQAQCQQVSASSYSKNWKKLIMYLLLFKRFLEELFSYHLISFPLSRIFSRSLNRPAASQLETPTCHGARPGRHADPRFWHTAGLPLSFPPTLQGFWWLWDETGTHLISNPCTGAELGVKITTKTKHLDFNGDDFLVTGLGDQILFTGMLLALLKLSPSDLLNTFLWGKILVFSCLKGEDILRQPWWVSEAVEMTNWLLKRRHMYPERVILFGAYQSTEAHWTGPASQTSLLGSHKEIGGPVTWDLTSISSQTVCSYKS